MECYPDVVDKKVARKRGINSKNWKRNCAKLERYSAKDLPIKPDCVHKSKLYCTEVSGIDLQRFHRMFYSLKEKEKQDLCIIKYVKGIRTRRRRPRSGKYNPRNIQLQYTIYCKTINKTVRICRKAFLNILRIKRYRVENIVKNYCQREKLPTETRGGDHKSHKFEAKKQSVIAFIKTFKCSEPHYCRDNTKRFYLPSELSINKMAKMYNEQADEGLKVKSLYFRSIFNTCFNLGFGSPRVDVCSTCLQLTEKIKTAKNDNDKKELMTTKTVHKRRAKAFFNILKDNNPAVKTFLFDCQKNMALPKIPDQSTYYSRQLYFFNFTVVEGNSKSPLTKENVFSYYWTEDQYLKDANLIVSSVYHRLCNTNYPPECKTVHLMADGCAGQNKNSMLIAMASKWLTQDAPDYIRLIEIVFPVVGHSFLPPDRVFARIEKELRKKESVVKPDEYTQVISEYSSTINVSSEVQVFDWKSVARNTFLDLGKWHVQFSKFKRFYLKKSTKCNQMVGVRGEQFYKIDFGEYKNICKKGKNIAMMTPAIVPRGVPVKTLKLRDVNKLLCVHYGNNWRDLDTLEYFARVIVSPLDVLKGADDDVDENSQLQCEEQQEMPTLLI